MDIEAIEDQETIAVVGISGRFPGAPDLDAYWSNLRDGRCAIVDFTAAELVAGGVDPAESSRPDYVPAKGYLADADRFEAELFGFNPREAEILDPQHRLLLEAAWRAFEDAGYDPRTVGGGHDVGVYVGGGLTEHAVSAQSDFDLADERGSMQVKLLTDKDYLASWISYRLGLTGPSVVVQTACATSLTAVHMAMQSLLLGECGLALAGGVSIDSLTKRGYLHRDGGVASPDGRCRPFDEHAAGTLGGNGVGLVVLRRYRDATRDGDTVYAILRGSAVTNDGAGKVGFTAPSARGQSAAITEALAAADVEPRTIQYVEMHGTGTSLGDRIEIAAATASFADADSASAVVPWCGIGSVKAAIGHLDAAAGIAGLLKVILMLRHREFVPAVNFTRPHPDLHLDTTPFYVVESRTPWPEPQGTPRRAGVTSVGLGGTNVHVVVEEAPAPRRAPTGPPGTVLLPVSARTERSAVAAAHALSRHLATGTDALTDGAALADVAATLQTGRAALGTRGFVVADGIEQAGAQFANLAEARGFTTATIAAAPLFVLPGQGNHYTDMGARLYRAFPAFRAAMDSCAEVLADRPDRDPRSWLIDTTDAGTGYWQPALFSIEYATAMLWRGWGVTPSAVVGHSLGEYVAAVLADVFSLADALRLVALRADLMASTVPGRMVAVALSEAQATAALRPGVELAAINGPLSCVLTGPGELLDAVVADLRAERVACRFLATDRAFHSAAMDPILDEFAAAVAAVRPRPAGAAFVSTMAGGHLDAARLAEPGYWRDQLRQPVRFAAAVEAAAAQADGVVLELGPGTSLTSRVRQIVAGRPAYATITEASETGRTLAALGEVWAHGHDVDWRRIGPSGARVPLPGYVFDAASRGALRLRRADSPAPASPPASQLASPPAPRPAEPPAPMEMPARVRTLDDDVTAMFLEALGIDAGGLALSFFDAGGDSLTAVHLAGKLRDRMEIEIPIALLLERLTLRELVGRIVGLAEARDADDVLGSLLREIEADPVAGAARHAARHESRTA